MTEELSGGHVLDDSSQGSENLSVRGEKEKESAGSIQDESQGQRTATQGRKRSTPSLGKATTTTTTTESCPIKKIKSTRKKGAAVKTPAVKPRPPTSLDLPTTSLPGEPSLADPTLSSKRLEKQEALVEALCLSVKQTNYHMNRTHHAEIPETQSLEF